MENLDDKLRGCIIGGAVGDALGYPVEFMRHTDITAAFGPKGITRYCRHGSDMACISDDTQMTIMTAAGLSEGYRHWCARGFNMYPVRFITDAYVAWYWAQNGMEPDALHKNYSDFLSALTSLSPLSARRAPGNTCITALAAISDGKQVKNDSKGCGGIMRVAPIATFSMLTSQPEEGASILAAQAAAITHLHPMGYLPAALMVRVLMRILRSERTVNINDIADWIEYSKPMLHVCLHMLPHKYNDHTLPAELISRSMEAIKLARGSMPDSEAIRHLGQGWTGDEAWYIALYCACRHIDSFEDAVTAAVNHDGDSDSTGAICGNIMGAIHGLSGIPQYYKIGLEAYGLLDMLATRPSFERSDYGTEHLEFEEKLYGAYKAPDLNLPPHTSQIADNDYCGGVWHTVSIPDSVKHIGREAFRRCSVYDLHIPYPVEDIGALAFSDGAFHHVTIHGSALAGNVGRNFCHSRINILEIYTEGYDNELRCSPFLMSMLDRVQYIGEIIIHTDSAISTRDLGEYARKITIMP